jgi:small subunit ribosomal protein S8
MKDSIADMMIQIKNGGLAKKDSVVLPFSKMKMSILEALLKTGFIKSVQKKGKKVIKYIEISLDYHKNGTPKISGVARVSKTSKRVYIKSKDIRPVKDGFGVMIISTPKGVMSGEEAFKEKLGGEVLVNVW